jgi:citrate lyase beta subunit
MIRPLRSMLFVSGERADRYPKALASGADLACIDLEDAVHPSRKTQARLSVCEFIAGYAPKPGDAQLAVRINAIGTADGLRDVLALQDSGARMDYLIVPKVQDPVELSLVECWLPHAFRHLVALIETPQGMQRAADIGAAVRAGAPRVSALMLGGADLSMELGAQFNWTGLLGARAALVMAAKASGLQAWDVPFIHIDDVPGLRQETGLALQMGFDCKTAIHPSQVAPIHECFAPAPQELAWAQGLQEAMDAQGGPAQIRGAFVYQGKLVDAPIIKRASRILATAALLRRNEQ